MSEENPKPQLPQPRIAPDRLNRFVSDGSDVIVDGKRLVPMPPPPPPYKPKKKEKPHAL